MLFDAGVVWVLWGGGEERLLQQMLQDVAWYNVVQVLFDTGVVGVSQVFFWGVRYITGATYGR